MHRSCVCFRSFLVLFIGLWRVVTMPLSCRETLHFAVPAFHITVGLLNWLLAPYVCLSPSLCGVWRDNPRLLCFFSLFASPVSRSACYRRLLVFAVRALLTDTICSSLSLPCSCSIPKYHRGARLSYLYLGSTPLFHCCLRTTSQTETDRLAHPL